MTLRRFAGFVLALALSSCGPEVPDPARGAPPAATPAIADAAPEAPAAAPPILSSVAYADVESRLGSAAGCSLERDRDTLLVAVSGNAIARVRGEVVKMDGAAESLDGLVQGGRYTGVGATVDIDLAPDLGEGDAADGVFTKPVRVTVTRSGQTERFTAVWICRG